MSEEVSGGTGPKRRVEMWDNEGRKVVDYERPGVWDGTVSAPRITLADFLLARIAEDYERERGAAALGSGQEFGARLRCNVRRNSIGFAVSMRRGYPVPYANDEAEKYADHPDFREEWRP